MQLFNTILVGLKEIWAHKMRSLLTMLGIILGVASLVAMAALTKGMENGMKETMIAMGGADKVLIDEQDVPPEQEHLAQEAPGRTMQDVIALKAAAPLVRLVSPEILSCIGFLSVFISALLRGSVAALPCPRPRCAPKSTCPFRDTTHRNGWRALRGAGTAPGERIRDRTPAGTTRGRRPP